jgi:protein SCO1/2
MTPRVVSFAAASAFWFLFWSQPAGADDVSLTAGDASQANVRTYDAEGVLVSIRPDANSVVIRHEAIQDYMGPMTMPFHLKNPAEVSELSPGDKISFRLNVTDTGSWADHIRKTGRETPRAEASKAPPVEATPTRPRSHVFTCKFTNELGQAVSLDDFRGQALAITFFYTRCPLPDYCPRLSKNFQTAMKQLEASPNAPTNWHFLSVTFDPLVDSPAMLKNYALNYGYDPAHWSFLTGAPDEIGELARGSGVTFRTVDGTIDHNFRTLIVDPAGKLRTVFPIGGDLSGEIAAEILKAVSATNQMVSQNRNQ